MENFTEPKFELLPDEEMTFDVESDSFGNLCLLAGCHMDGNTKVYTKIRLDQIPCKIRSRSDLIGFIDAYMHNRTEDGFIPGEEQKFKLGFASRNGEPVLYASVRVRNGFVHTDRIPLSKLMKHQRSVKTLESAIVNRNQRNA